MPILFLGKGFSKVNKADKGMKLRDNKNGTCTHWKGIHVMKDAAVTIKMALENLASWFCRMVLMWLLLRFTQIKMY